jgi:hypothetical protein
MPGGTSRRDAQTGALEYLLARPEEFVMPASVWIINLVVLGVVLEADLGRRKITWFRLARPLLVAGAIIVYYLIKTPPATGGGGLGFEVALAALGIILGVAAGLIFRVFRGSDGFPRSQAGIGYAALWIVVVAGRIGFSYATSHSRHLQVWLLAHHITADAITDALIFMAAGMLVLRTAVLRLRAVRLPGTTAGTRRAGQQAAVSSPADG